MRQFKRLISQYRQIPVASLIILKILIKAGNLLVLTYHANVISWINLVAWLVSFPTRLSRERESSLLELTETLDHRVKPGDDKGERLDGRARGASPRLHEAIQNHLPAGLVEIDCELVAIDFRDRAGPEFDVKHAVALAVF